MWLCILLYIVLQSRRLFLFSSSFSWFNGRSGSGKLAKRRGVKYSKSCSGLLCPHIPSNPIYRAVPLLQASSFLCCHAELCAMCGVGKGEVEKKWMEWGRKKHSSKAKQKGGDRPMTSTRKGVVVVVCLSRRHLKLKSVQIYCFLKSDTPDTRYMRLWEYGRETKLLPPKRWHTNPL